MAARILSLLLCLLIAGPMSLPAHAFARPETRVGGSPVFASAFASADRDQTLEAHRESRGCGYDFASGVCKYLYCQADPVNRIDPSGMMDLIQLQAVMTKVSGLAAYTAYRVAPLANRVTIILYESVTGSTVVGGAGLLAGGKITMTIVGGGTKIIDPIAKATTEKIALLGFKEAGKYDVWPFKMLQKLVPVGSGLEKHHLVEKRFANTLGVAADDIPSIALTKAEHEIYTQRWLAEIGRRNMDVPVTTQNATIDNILDAAEEVYHDAPELLEFVKTFLNK